MLRSVTSEEITEWLAFYKIKDQEERTEQAAADAHERAKQNNR